MPGLQQPMKPGNAILIIICSVFISFLVAVSADIPGGMGGLANFFIPLFSGFFSLIMFLILWVIPKTPRGKIILTVLICLYNLHAGFFIRYDWPSPFLIS